MRRGLFLVGLLLMGSVAGVGFLIAQVELPEDDILLQSTFICAGDVVENCDSGNSIATLAGEQDRVLIPIGEIPQVFIDATLAAEDRNFFSHQGLDPIGIARALVRNLRSEEISEGGSTITQQYAKLAFLSSERTISRKIKEAILAIQLEREFSKEEILERYLNRVYLGRGAYGVEAASRAYFDRSIRDLNLSQAAYLAGLLRSPETADVSRDVETATFRRNSVLNGMADMGTITDEQRDAAKATDLFGQVIERSTRGGLGRVKGAAYGTEFFVDYVRRLLYAEYGSEIVNTGGLRVYTTLNMDYQQAGYNAVYGTLDQDTDPEGALVTVDESGGVVALVGGQRFGDDTEKGESEVNLALGTLGGGLGRQPGSSFKPFVLATALEQGISVRSKFQNVNELEFDGANAGADYEMSNYADSAEEKVMDLVEATRISSNTIYGQLIQETGYQAVVDTAHALGVDAELPAVLTLALGSGEVSVLDMADGYSTFARRGQHIEPFFITKVEQVTAEGTQVLFTREPEAEQVIEPTVADQVNAVLRGVMNGGTGRNAEFGIPAAGKTGTTQDYRDAWFVGYTPKLTTAVWMGYPDPDADGNPRYMDNVRGIEVTGSSFPSQIWRQYMVAVTGAESQGDFAAADYGGDVLNPNLVPTTTTLPVCGSAAAAEEDDEAREEAADDGEELAPDYTAPCSAPTTTTEATTTTAAEDTTTTTAEAETTTTTAAEPE